MRLRDYGSTPDVDGLAQDLMGRIENEMPLLFVPLLARVLLLAEKPLDGVALEQEMARMAALAPVNMFEGDEGFGANVVKARQHLLQRGIIAAVERGYRPADTQRSVLRFYANSIAHFFDR